MEMKMEPGLGCAGRAKRCGFIASLILVLLAVSCATRDFTITTPAFGSLPDGEYRGSYDGGIVRAEVLVVMVGGRIDAVRVLRHECGKGKPAERIVGSIVAAQSLEVDVIAGASYSSRVILKAVEVALGR